MSADFWTSSSASFASDPQAGKIDPDTFFGSSALLALRSTSYKSRAVTHRGPSGSSPISASSAPQIAAQPAVKATKRKADEEEDWESSDVEPQASSQPKRKSKKAKVAQRAEDGYKFACLPCAKYYVRRQDLKKHYTLFHDGADPPSFELVLDPSCKATSAEMPYVPTTLRETKDGRPETPAIPTSSIRSSSVEDLEVPSSPPALSVGASDPDSSFEFSGLDQVYPRQYTSENAFSSSLPLPLFARHIDKASSNEPIKAITEQDELDFINFLSPTKERAPNSCKIAFGKAKEICPNPRDNASIRPQASKYPVEESSSSSSLASLPSASLTSGKLSNAASIPVLQPITSPRRQRVQHFQVHPPLFERATDTFLSSGAKLYPNAKAEPAAPDLSVVGSSTQAHAVSDKVSRFETGFTPFSRVGAAAFVLSSAVPRPAAKVCHKVVATVAEPTVNEDVSVYVFPDLSADVSAPSADVEAPAASTYSRKRKQVPASSTSAALDDLLGPSSSEEALEAEASLTSDEGYQPARRRSIVTRKRSTVLGRPTRNSSRMPKSTPMQAVGPVPATSELIQESANATRNTSFTAPKRRSANMKAKPAQVQAAVPPITASTSTSAAEAAVSQPAAPKRRSSKVKPAPAAGPTGRKSSKVAQKSKDHICTRCGEAFLYPSWLKLHLEKRRPCVDTSALAKVQEQEEA